MKRQHVLWLLVVLVLVFASCAPAYPDAEPAPVTEPEVEDPAPVVEEEEVVEEPEEVAVDIPEGCGFDITIGSNGDGRIVNPILAIDTDGIWRSDLIADALIWLDPATLEPRPRLAESWDISDGGRTYTFHLTDADVRWHDGEPFSVEDIEFSLMEILAPDYTGIYQSRFADLVGADAVIAGEADELEGFQIVDDRTVQFTLNEPSVSFLAVAIKDLKFIPKHILEGEEVTEDHPYSLAPIGTGPYKFKEWDKGNRFVMEWNLDYWGELPCARTITTVVIPDMQAIAAAVETGDIDVSITVATTEIPRLAETPGLVVYNQPSVGAESLWFHLEHPILQDVRVRRAMAHAIDAEAFTENLLMGLTEPSNAHISNASWAYNADAQVPEFDPDRAIELLEEAGYPDGFSIKMSTNQGNFFRELFVEYAQAELARVSIDVEIEKAEWGTFIGNVIAGDYETRFHNQTAGVPDPDVIYDIFHTDGGNNWSKYSNPEVDELLDVARNNTDLEVRREAYYQILAILNEDLPGFPAFWRPNNLVTRDVYTNITPSVLYIYGNIHQWRLSE